MANTLIPHRHGVNLFDSFRREMDSLFQRFEGDSAVTPQGVAVWAPRVDVEETEKEFHIQVDVPGVDPKDVDIRFQDQVLTIRGTKDEMKEAKSKNFHRVERFVGQFYRAITLPAGMDTENMSAIGSNGTITITISKKAEAQPRKIAVQPKMQS